jgi:hypothetical protein
MKKQKAKEFYKNINSLHCDGTCIGSTRVPDMIDRSVKANYKIVKSLLKKYCPIIYNTLALHLRNPWSHETYRTKNNSHIIITHSQINYAFKIN